MYDLLKFENEALNEGYSIIAGVDEAGRGPLAGPVVASAVIFSIKDVIDTIKDSKKLSEKKREKVYGYVIEKAKDYGVGIVDEKEIDRINILNASLKAMKIAVNSLKLVPDILFIDGNKILDGIKTKQRAIIGGDNLSAFIAASSIIAKVTRDNIMREYDKIFPQYGFAKHKGYGTKEHYKKIKEYGPCDIHRRSFMKYV
jgi:ribonuclease HII